MNTDEKLTYKLEVNKALNHLKQIAKKVDCNNIFPEVINLKKKLYAKIDSRES